MLTGLYFYYVATCYTMKLPIFCFLLTSRPEDNVQKNLWEKTLINKNIQSTPGFMKDKLI